MNPDDIAKKYGGQRIGTEYLASKYGGAPVINQPDEFQTLFGSEGLASFAKGMGKGVLSTAQGLSSFGEQVAGQTVGRLGNIIAGNGNIPVKQESFKSLLGGEENLKKLTQPQGTAENIGFGAEKIAEFLIPSSALAKGEQTINLLAQGIKSPLGAALTRIGGKAAVQATGAGLVGLAQTGDIKEAGKIASTAGLTRGAMGAVGETARALKIPERIYSVIFKNSANDMRSELTADALARFKQTNPIQYEDFVKKGLIKTTGGVPAINDTLAEKALDKGLRGSFKNMATEVVTKSLQSEDDLQTILANYKGTVDVSEKQFVNVLKSIAQEYEDVGFGEVSQQAAGLADKIAATGGKLDGETALVLRRFMDRMRIASSFDKPVSKLSMTQANFKTLADTVRGRIAEIKLPTGLDAQNLKSAVQIESGKALQAGSKVLSQSELNALAQPSVSELVNVPERLAGKTIGTIMKDYSFYLDAMESIAKEAAKRGNSQILGMIDSLFLGGAAISSNPSSLLTMGLLRRIAQSPTALTNLAQIIRKSAASPTTSALIGATSAGLNNVVSQ
jgi:hypothetical protein